MTEPTNRADPTPPPPLPVFVRPRRRWVGYAMLAASFVAGLVWVYFVWLRTTAPAPPEADLEHADPMAADAIRLSRALVAAQPRDPAAWGEYAMVLHAHDYFAEAKACYAQAEQFDPAQVTWPYLHGICCLREGDSRGAVEHFRRAVNRSTQSPVPHLRLGELLLGAGRFEEAEELFREVHRFDPAEPRAHLGLARLELGRGNTRACVRHVHNCLSQTGDLPQACLLLAEAYHALGEDDLAADAQRRAKQTTTPDEWPDPYLGQVAGKQQGMLAFGRRAAALYRAGRKDEALNVMQDLVALHPDSAKAVGGLGRMYVLIDQAAVAEPHLRRSLELDPKLLEVRYYLATALMKQDKLTEAVTEFRRVIEIQPDFEEASLRLGQCLYLLNDKPGAATALRDAVRYAPGNPKAQKNLAVVLFELRRYDEAVKHLELAQALTPQDRDLSHLLKQARVALAQHAK